MPRKLCDFLTQNPIRYVESGALVEEQHFEDGVQRMMMSKNSTSKPKMINK